MEEKRLLRITGKVQETPETFTFTLEPADGRPYDYRPGQYLSLIFDKNGREARRAYSFSTCPGVDVLPAITVKRVVNGEYSNHLIKHAVPGDTLRTTSANGRFLLPERGVDTIVYVAAGSGITPVMGHLKCLLAAKKTDKKAKASKILLLYASRDSRSTIFKAQIDRWIADFPGRFECIYFFSREKDAAHALFRHLNNGLFEQMLLRYFGGGITTRHKKNTLFYLCAPTALMRMAAMTLRVLDFPDGSIIKETFVPDKNLPSRVVNPLVTHTIVAMGNDERIEFQTFGGETILGAALRQGIALPYSCKSGICLSCLAKCVQGEVDVAFSDQTRREGPGAMINTCIGYAVSERVEIVYQ